MQLLRVYLDGLTVLPISQNFQLELPYRLGKFWG